MEVFSCLPWEVSTTGERPKVVDAAGMGVCHMTYAPTWAEQNARRIVVCVNACSGIDTDHLEKHGLPGFAEKLSALVEQRDELLTALKDAIEEIKGMSGQDMSCDPAADVSYYEEIIARTEAR
jgi:hypothetical protein